MHTVGLNQIYAQSGHMKSILGLHRCSATNGHLQITTNRFSVIIYAFAQPGQCIANQRRPKNLLVHAIIILMLLIPISKTLGFLFSGSYFK